MKRMRAKLNSQNGASILIALVFLLLCLTVGSVVLTAATANAGRLRSQRRAQQDYQTVSSAALLVRGQLSGTSFSAQTVVTDGGSPAVSFGDSGSGLPATLRADARTLFQSGTQPSARNFTVAVEGLDEVHGSFQMHSDYSVTVTLYLGEASARRSPLRLEIPAQTAAATAVSVWDESVDGVDENNQPIKKLVSHRTVTTTFTVSWNKGLVEKEVSQ